MNKLLFSILLILAAILPLSGETPPPDKVVIDRMVSTYHLVPNKNRDAVEKIRQTTEINLSSRRPDAKAVTFIYYNDDISLSTKSPAGKRPTAHTSRMCSTQTRRHAWSQLP
ncbi:MAG: hypothetical protein NC336_02175 [Clostridium sp.]|nr:hypothetical protein [Clostridium sp.]